MMNAAFRALGLDAFYMALRVDDAAEALRIIGEMGFRGLSVTLPHKEACFAAVEKCDETARRIGAINTLRFADGRWEGINTDWTGLTRALLAVAPLAGKRVAVLGAGGAARAAVFGMLREGAAATVINRVVERGEGLAREFNCDFMPLSEIADRPEEIGRGFDVAIQCTPSGMTGGGVAAIVPEPFFHGGMVAMDTVYTPRMTPFLQAAEKAGCKLGFGLEMFLHQGAAQFEWWWDRPAPVNIMRHALRRAEGHE